MLGVALRIGAALLLGLGRGVGGTGNTQVVLQFVACELQDTIQLVVVEVTGVESPGVGTTTLGVACAKAGPDAAVTATARMILNAVITASPRCESHHTAYWQILAYGRSWTRPLLRHASVAGWGGTYQGSETQTRFLRIRWAGATPSGDCGRAISSRITCPVWP